MTTQSRKASLRSLCVLCACGKKKPKTHVNRRAQMTQRLRRFSRMDLAFFYTRGGSWIVAVVTPGGMVEVKHKVAVIGDHCVVKSQVADTLPITEADGCRKFTVR